MLGNIIGSLIPDISPQFSVRLEFWYGGEVLVNVSVAGSPGSGSGYREDALIGLLYLQGWLATFRPNTARSCSIKVTMLMMFFCHPESGSGDREDALIGFLSPQG
jgi:hypothetical protein